MTGSRRLTHWPEVSPIETDSDTTQSQDLHQEPAQVEPPRTAPGVENFDATSQNNSTDETRPVKWGITWKLPILALSSFLASILTALGHHLFYSGLENTPVLSADQQTWAIRIGTGLAFLNKTFLIAIMSMIGTQQIWVTLRQKFMTLQGIDSMFQIMNDPTAVFDSQLWARAKTLLLLAIMSWFIPLVAVVTPATLSVRSSMSVDVVSSVVPTVNFANLTGWASYEGLGRIDSPTFEIGRIFEAVASSVSFLPLTAPFTNSSYDLSFWGPSYKCQNFKDALVEQNSPNEIQQAWDKLIETQMANTYRGVAPDSLNNTILIWTAGGNNTYTNLTTGLPEEPGTSILCQLYNTSYDITMSFNQGVHLIIPRSIQYLNPHTFNSTAAGMALVNNEPGMGTAWVTHLLFRYFLIGNMSVGDAGTVLTYNQGNSMPFLQSGLIGCPEFWNSTEVGFLDYGKYTDFHNCRNRSLPEAIEDLSRNFTYSTMAATYQRGEFTTKVPITVTSPRNFYSYDTRNLVIAYVSSLVVVLLWMGVGGTALWSNGVTSNMSFSTIVLTTRNSDLDRLGEGYSLGADPLPKHIGDARLMFGRLDNGTHIKRGGFGFKGTVTPVQKGDVLL